MRRLPRRIACALIKRYQDNGGGLRYFGIACNFTQTCSEYTRQAIEDRGLWIGARLGAARIRRCRHRHLTHKLEDTYTPESSEAA